MEGEEKLLLSIKALDHAIVQQTEVICHIARMKEQNIEDRERERPATYTPYDFTSVMHGYFLGETDVEDRHAHMKDNGGDIDGN